jgi:hypothetical protein
MGSGDDYKCGIAKATGGTCGLFFTAPAMITPENPQTPSWQPVFQTQMDEPEQKSEMSLRD